MAGALVLLPALAHFLMPQAKRQEAVQKEALRAVA
jgi:hypothetical protein